MPAKTEETAKAESADSIKATSATETSDTRPNTETLSNSAEEQSNVTTEQRKPLEVPSSVHVRITPDNLKDYVGPPVYQKDRMYVQPPPPGVSTGLGYLGNGSGAVMPVEVSVSQNTSIRQSASLLNRQIMHPLPSCACILPLALSLCQERVVYS